MIYILNTQGTTVGVISEPIYQGSINANSIMVVAPFSKTAVITVAYTLPNGLGVVGGMMENSSFQLTSIGETPLTDKEGNIYNVWQIDIGAPVTQYAGTVQVQFTVNLGYGTSLRTYSTQFAVQKGVPVDLPPFSEIQNAENLYNQIADYIASINENVVDATDKAISYVRYITDDNYLINTQGASGITLTALPNSASVNGNFTVDGMTEYLTENQIENPYLDTNKDDLFFGLNTDVNAGMGGFIIDLGEVKSVGIVQIYVWNVTTPITVEALAAGSDNAYTVADTITFAKTAGTNALEIYRFNINKECRYIKFLQLTAAEADEQFKCKGVEVFAPNVDGYYKIVQNNGNVIEIDTFNASALIAELEQITAEAQGYADDALSALTQINNKAGQVGGYPVLENIDGAPKIPAVYINQVDIHNQIEITNESELATITAEPGDVAYLVETLDGVKTVTKSWILLSVTDNTRNWAVYGTSYATNAGNAQYATSAGNAQQINGIVINKLTQAQYNALADKTGVYFVTID